MGTHGGVKWLFGASGCDETKRTEPVRSEWAWDTERIELPLSGAPGGYGFGTLLVPAGPSAVAVTCAEREWVRLGEARTVTS